MKNRFRSSTLWRFLGFLKPYRFQYFAAMLIVAAIFTSERMFTGLVVKWFTDAIVNLDLEMMKNSVLYWGLFALGMMVVSPYFLYVWRTSIVRGTANLRQRIFSHLQRLPLGYYADRHSGEALSLLANDVTTAEQVYGENIYNLVSNIMQGFAAIGLMLYLKWDLTLLIVFSSLLPLVINTLYAKPLRQIGQETQSRLANLSGRLVDLLAGFQIVRTFNLADWILERFKRSNENVLDTSLKRVQLESTLESANNFAGILFFLPLLVGTYLVLQGKTTMGTLIGLTQLNNQVQGLVYSFGGLISGIQGSLAAADRILATLDTAPEPEYYPATDKYIPPTQPGSVIEFQDVHFDYTDGRPTLHGITFDIQEGHIAAIVGPSGSGKSTILRLLMGYYPVNSGGISIFGKALHSYALHELRDLFSFVPQDAYLYTGTVMENIRYGRPGASKVEITEAAAAAYAHEFILELPEGYQTVVGERGSRLSGGQRQRIAIARALLKKAPFLLLDEATSALDSESETLVQQALEVLMEERTTIVIAHRLSTIESADIIHVVDKGRVVEKGRHQELIGKQGLYHHLYELQFQDD